MKYSTPSNRDRSHDSEVVPKKWRAAHFAVGAGLIGVVVAMGVATLSTNVSARISTQADDSSNPYGPFTVELTIPPASGEPAPMPADSNAESTNWRKVTVKSGDTLGAIFKSNGLGAAQLAKVMAAGPEAKGLARIRPGQVLMFDFGADGTLRALLDEQGPAGGLRIVRSADGG